MKILSLIDILLIDRFQSKSVTYPVVVKKDVKNLCLTLDHVTPVFAVLTPFGITDEGKDHLAMNMGQSFETSDWFKDCGQLWWDDNKDNFSKVK